jgi:pyruvate/2-oxoglutarate dehydrogenase complex dihydrolipoamide dehydrogenase (E3) component
VSVRDLDSGIESTAHYDELLIATGASGISPRWPCIDAKGALQLRTLDDAAKVERLLIAGARRAVVVGAGYIRLEVAEGLFRRGLQVTVVERLDAPMNAVLDADIVVIEQGGRSSWHCVDARQQAGPRGRYQHCGRRCRLSRCPRDRDHALPGHRDRAHRTY